WVLARLELQQKRPREALGAIELALAQDPDNPELHLVRAEALGSLGDADALTAYRLAVLKAELPAGRPPGQPFGVLPARIQALVARALQGSGGPARYHRALAQYLMDRKLWEQALAEWDAVLAAGPGDGEAHFARGIVLDALGRGTAALPEYRQAVALDGTRRAFRLRLAQRLWETEQYYQAMNEWRSVLGQDPGNIEARLGLARAHAKAGDRAAAAQEYLRILQITPDQPEARRELARLGRAAGT
ncbi:MAG: tetratricopeptide repeat protein, partial [Candidatus Methylomirabilales bacterium]